MNITPIRPGDLVRCDVRGQKFVAEVVGKEGGELALEPVNRPFIPAYKVKARQVVNHWRLAGRRRAS
jgi:hypothetical protein